MFIRNLILPWRKPLRRYYVKSLFPLLLTLVIFAVGINSPQLLIAPWQKIIWIFLALIPFFWACRIYILYLSECDEVERKIELDAIAVGSFLTISSGIALMLAISTKLYIPDAEVAIETVVFSLCIGYALARGYWLWRFLK